MNYGGLHWIDKEVHGMLVVVSDVVETDSMTYLKVFTEINIQKKIYYKLNNLLLHLKYQKFFFIQCVIAQNNNGIMVLLKRHYLIDMIYQNRNINMKVTIRFFNLNDHVIDATDKTEIELDDQVSIYTFLYLFQKKRKIIKKNDIITIYYNDYVFK